MVFEESTRRDNEYLVSIMDETSRWIVTGPQGVPLCEGVSLRHAVEMATEFTTNGRKVIALVRRMTPEIIVFSGQIEQLTERLANCVALKGQWAARSPI